jgi:hypothetical protein
MRFGVEITLDNDLAEFSIAVGLRVGGIPPSRYLEVEYC